MEKEIWKDIKGYEGLYQVSSYGRVRGVDRVIFDSDGRKRLQKGRILKPSKNSDGYLRIRLCNNGQKKTVKIHRLVAEAFIPNPNNLPEVNHKDENKASNFVSNLEFCTRSYNINYGTRNKRISEKRSMSVHQIDINTGRVISEYPSAREAERQLNINSSGISMCCNGKLKTYKGFKWQYK